MKSSQQGKPGLSGQSCDLENEKVQKKNRIINQTIKIFIDHSTFGRLIQTHFINLLTH